MGMVNWVHGNTTNLWTPTKPTGTARLAKLYVTVIFIANLANGCSAIQVHHSNFARWQSNRAPFFVFAKQLSRNTSCPTELGPTAYLDLDSMDNGTNRDIPDRHAIAWLDVRLTTRNDGVAY
jgi:hypothetical protein